LILPLIVITNFYESIECKIYKTTNAFHLVFYVEVHHTEKFSVFEATNKRQNNLYILFDALKTIKPSSVASERVFSISGNFVSKMRTKLNHRSVDILCFLKSYFLKKKTK
jgi:hypothetical protein